MDGQRTVRTFDWLAARVLETPPSLGPVRVVCIDGCSGAGKTTLAANLFGSLTRAGLKVGQIHTDDLLDGWDDLADSWRRLHDEILAPLAIGEPALYRCYDWSRGAFGAAVHRLEPPDVLLLEGVGSGRRVNCVEACLLIFVCGPDPAQRLERVVARDGEAVRAPLQRWSQAESRHFEAERTRMRADLVVDGSAGFDRAPLGEFVQICP